MAPNLRATNCTGRQGIPSVKMEIFIEKIEWQESARETRGCQWAALFRVKVVKQAVYVFVAPENALASFQRTLE